MTTDNPTVNTAPAAGDEQQQSSFLSNSPTPSPLDHDFSIEAAPKRRRLNDAPSASTVDDPSSSPSPSPLPTSSSSSSMDLDLDPDAALSGESPPQRVLHDNEEADLSLLHNTLAGQMMEREQLERREEDEGHVGLPSEAEQPEQTEHSNLSSSPTSSLPLSPSPPILSLSSSPLPLPSLSPSPISTSPTPTPPLGYYQCERCTALLSYSSLTEIYHCPLCSHSFTLYPPLAPPPSNLFPLTYPPFPSTALLITLTWSPLHLSHFLRSVPPLSHLARRTESSYIDGKRFMEMSVEELIDEYGLWGGTSDKWRSHGAVVVKLMEAQKLLRGEEGFGEEGGRLMEALVGMQRIAVGERGGKVEVKGQTPATGKKRKVEEGQSGGEGATGVQATVVKSGAGMVSTPVKTYKIYRLPPMPQAGYSAITAASLPSPVPQLIQSTPITASHTPTPATLMS